MTIMNNDVFAGEDIVFLATDINLPGAVDWVMMQSCFGHHFMLVLEKQEKFDGHQQFFAIVQLIGSRKQAENFAYRYSSEVDISVYKGFSTHFKMFQIYIKQGSSSCGSLSSTKITGGVAWGGLQSFERPW